MNPTPLTAIRNPDGQMYLKEENPFDPQSGHISQAEYNRFEAAHPPIIALFECEEGQQFFEGVDVRLGYAGREYKEDAWYEISESQYDRADEPQFTIKAAFQLIEQKENQNDRQIYT